MMATPSPIGLPNPSDGPPRPAVCLRILCQTISIEFSPSLLAVSGDKSKVRPRHLAPRSLVLKLEFRELGGIFVVVENRTDEARQVLLLEPPVRARVAREHHPAARGGPLPADAERGLYAPVLIGVAQPEFLDRVERAGPRVVDLEVIAQLHLAPRPAVDNRALFHASAPHLHADVRLEVVDVHPILGMNDDPIPRDTRRVDADLLKIRGPFEFFLHSGLVP